MKIRSSAFSQRLSNGIGYLFTLVIFSTLAESHATEPQTTIQSSLAINHLIDSAGSDAGSMMLFAGGNAPSGTLLADGSVLSIIGNEELFAALGTTYGGNGTVNFALPDLRGRVAVGSGQGSGLTNRVLGSSFGVTQTTVTQAQMPVAAGGQGQAFTNLQPSLTLAYAIQTANPAPGGSGGLTNPMLGQVLLSAAGSLSADRLAASGQTLLINDYTDLFSLIGTTYGGDGQDTFALPDLQGRTPVGVGAVALGALAGTETTTLTLANLPPPSGSATPYNNRQPSTGMNYIIALTGTYPNSVPDPDESPFIGEISLFSGGSPVAPSGWAFADGQLLLISANPALFSILGTTYGGNGSTNFNLPSLNDRAALGADGTYPRGSQVGSNSLTLTSAQVIPEPSILGFIGLAGALLLMSERFRKKERLG